MLGQIYAKNVCEKWSEKTDDFTIPPPPRETPRALFEP